MINLNEIPEEIQELINNKCDMLTLFKLSQTSKENLQIYQQLIFKRYEVNYKNELIFYDIKQITQIKNSNNLKDKHIKRLIGLTDLDLCYNKYITDEGIKHLINLTNLDLSWNKNITNEGIKYLTNLTKLNLGRNNNITYECIKYLTKLNYLELGWNTKLTNECVEHLTNLSIIYNS